MPVREKRAYKEIWKLLSNIKIMSVRCTCTVNVLGCIDMKKLKIYTNG